MRQPNPLDPLDGFKRWYTDLWPMQRVGFWLGLLLLLIAVAAWITRGL